MNYFELFGLPVAPTVDRGRIAKTYFELQKKNHPDYFSQANEAEQEDALQTSAAINKAFKIFQNPDKTIEYFLQTKNLIETDEKYNLPPGFLMEMMEINETFTDDPALATQQVEAYETKLYESVKPIIQNYSSTSTVSELQQLKAWYYQKKYLNRILDRLGD